MSLAICAACGLRFASDDSFDRHQVGAYSDIHPEWRRCLTQTELMAGHPIHNGQRTPWRLNSWNAWTHRVPPDGVQVPTPLERRGALVRRQGPEFYNTTEGVLWPT